MINRRDAIKRTALMLGYAVSASSVAMVMSGCKADPAVVAGGLENWTPVAMTKDQGQLIAHLAETVLPKTDTPGAIEAGVHSYFDNALNKLSSKEEVSGFKMWIEDFAKRCSAANGKSFVDSDQKQRVSFLTNYEKAAKVAAEKEELPLSIWFQIKEQILLGYFTSELGMTKALVHLPIPGEYKPCIPVEEVGGTWAI